MGNTPARGMACPTCRKGRLSQREWSVHERDFALLDTDNSGALSKDEVKQLAVAQLGREVEGDMLDDFFSKVIHVCMLARVPSMVTDCAHFLPMPSLTVHI